MPGYSLAHHLRDRTPGHGQNRCAAGHCLHHYQAKRFVPLNWKQHGDGITQEFVLCCKVRQSDVFHELSVKLWFDFLLKVLTVCGLHVPRYLEWDSSTLRHIDCNMGTF